MLDQIMHPLHTEEIRLLLRLRETRRRHRIDLAAKEAHKNEPGLALGDRVSDAVAAIVGSWRFIIIQSVILVIWMILNVTGYVLHWDPYPFILLNLVLSFQAAYTAPVIMMSQNRQSDIDRLAAKHDYDVNLKSELEIELLHQKIDLLRETEMSKLIDTIATLQAEVQAFRQAMTPPVP